jgi:hypothetical protein
MCNRSHRLAANNQRIPARCLGKIAYRSEVEYSELTKSFYKSSTESRLTLVKEVIGFLLFATRG